MHIKKRERERKQDLKIFFSVIVSITIQNLNNIADLTLNNLALLVLTNLYIPQLKNVSFKDTCYYSQKI